MHLKYLEQLPAVTQRALGSSRAHPCRCHHMRSPIVTEEHTHTNKQTKPRKANTQERTRETPSNQAGLHRPLGKAPGPGMGPGRTEPPRVTMRQWDPAHGHQCDAGGPLAHGICKCQALGTSAAAANGTARRQEPLSFASASTRGGTVGS